MKMTGLLMLALMGVAAATQQYGQGPVQPGGGQVVTLTYSLSGIIILDGHRCVFRDGELRMTGRLLNIGERGEFTLGEGFATTESGSVIHIDGGRLEAVSLPSTDRQAISNALTRTGITVEEFFEGTGTVPPMNGVFEILSGVNIVDGVYYQVSVGVVVVLAVAEVEPTGPGVVQPTVGPAVGGGQTQTIYVTEAYQTRTAVESVTLTKFSTRDLFVTVTAPVYNSVDATVTNFVRQVVNVPEDQVIRSQAGGNVVVNTITVPSQTVMVVRDTRTNFYVQTVVGDAVSTLQHVATNFSFQTVTITIPVTSSVVQTITSTSVANVYVTQTVGSTIYTTTTVIISQGSATQTRGY